MASLYDLIADAETLLQERQQILNCISTAAIPESHQQRRTVICRAVQFGYLPSGTVLHAAHNCVFSVDNEPIDELLIHGMRGPSPDVEPPRPDMRTVVNIDEDCVLLTRYGYGTWGHWLGEIVPQVAVLEAFYPGRFRYAVPQHDEDWYRRRILQTLTYYGIHEDRIIWVKIGGGPFVFPRARIVTPIWSGHTPHPFAISLMRHRIRMRPIARVGLLRSDWHTRQIVNLNEVRKVLEAHGFYVTDTAGMDFEQQIDLFASTSHLFGILGSGLTGLIYAPDQISVFAGAPLKWNDGFFHGIAQQRPCARWTELRGQSEWDGRTGLMRDAPFVIPIKDLEAALQWSG
jgi:hypothetical protein